MRKNLSMLMCLIVLTSMASFGWTQEANDKAAGKTAKIAPRPLKGPSEGANFRISFKMRNRELESSGNFVVQGGSQANYTNGGDIPMVVENARGKGVEFKKHGVIVNCLAVENPNNGRVRAECQFELSGPLAPITELKVSPVETFQLQTSFEVEKGRTLLLTDEPERRIEVKIEEVAP